MDFITQWLNGSLSGEFCFTVLVSMLPVVELRGGIPFGVAHGLPLPLAVMAAVIGNMLPIPFLILFTRRVSSPAWSGRRSRKRTWSSATSSGGCWYWWPSPCRGPGPGPGRWWRASWTCG